MKRITTVKGFIVYEASAVHHYMCSQCYGDWISIAKFYKEDIRFEIQTAQHWELEIPMEKQMGGTHEKLYSSYRCTI